MQYLIERKSYYKIGDIVLIEYWYDGRIVPVRILDRVGNQYHITHKVPDSKIQNAPDEKIKSSDIIDYFSSSKDLESSE